VCTQIDNAGNHPTPQGLCLKSRIIHDPHMDLSNDRLGSTSGCESSSSGIHTTTLGCIGGENSGYAISSNIQAVILFSGSDFRLGIESVGISSFSRYRWQAC